MEQQQLKTLLAIERDFLRFKSVKSHPKRRLIANSLHKLNDDEKISDDIFALTMNIFDRFIRKSSEILLDRQCQLVALCCFNLAKKLRTNTFLNNENEQTSLILFNQNYTDEEIFTTEQCIAESLDWDLAMVVPHDYLTFLLQCLPAIDIDLARIRLHVHILLSLAICELNTLTILPSVLCSACLKEALKGFRELNIAQIDEMILTKINGNSLELHQTQRMVEQYFQLCIQDIPTPIQRRCLAPIDTINKRNAASPRVK